MKKLLFLTLITCLIFSCTKDNDGDENYHRLKYATVKGMKLGYYRSDLSISRTSEKPWSSTYVVVDENGNVKPLQFVNERGDTVNMYTESMTPVGDNHLILKGEYMVNSNSSYYAFPYLIVDKNTELLWGMKLDNVYVGSNSHELQWITSDSRDNIYFMSWNIVYKINTSDQSNLTLEKYTPDTQEVFHYDISDNGTCVYYTLNDVNKVSVNFKLANNTIKNIRSVIPDHDEYDETYSLTIDGKIHVIEKRNHGFADNKLDFYRVDDDKDINLIKVASINFNREFYYDSYYFINPINNKILFNTSSELVEVDQNSGVVKRIPINMPTIVLQAKQLFMGVIPKINSWMTSDAVFSIEEGILYRLDLRTYDVKTLDLMSCGYDINNKNVTASTSSGVLNFSGTRYSDGMNVVGEISDDLQITLYPNMTSSNYVVSSLVRLN